MNRTWSVFGAALLLAAAGCARQQPPDRPNVLLIVVDTLRRDAVGVYGAEHPTTPALDALARAGVAYGRAYSTAPWTKPSVASIFTGQLPSRHGCQHVLGGLAPEADTLAEILGRRGYARRGVVSHRLVAGRSRLDQGFERYRSDHARDNVYLSTGGVVEQGLEDLEALAAERRPFLLFLHFFDPHARYMRNPEAGFAAARAGRLDGSELLTRLRTLVPTLTAEERALVRAIYLEEARRVDEGIGRVFERLRALDLWDSTAIVVTADHGEELAQRGWLEHTRTLYDELVRVPLVVKPPAGVAFQASAAPVSLVSILPTILAWTGGDTAAVLDGRPLGAGDPAPVYAEVDYQGLPGDPVGDVTLRAVISGRFKLIEERRTGALRLFDLAADPGESRDLADERAEVVRVLRRQLSVFDQAAAGALPATPDEMDEETRAILRSLGYVGG